MAGDWGCPPELHLRVGGRANKRHCEERCEPKALSEVKGTKQSQGGSGYSASAVRGLINRIPSCIPASQFLNPTHYLRRENDGG